LVLVPHLSYVWVRIQVRLSVEVAVRIVAAIVDGFCALGRDEGSVLGGSLVLLSWEGLLRIQGSSGSRHFMQLKL
jgi:hypothetical protein